MPRDICGTKMFRFSHFFIKIDWLTRFFLSQPVPVCPAYPQTSPDKSPPSLSKALASLIELLA